MKFSMCELVVVPAEGSLGCPAATATALPPDESNGEHATLEGLRGAPSSGVRRVRAGNEEHARRF
ncbi:MAG: hypothetical protein ABI548_09380 [Polyangiaceae bacterium]